MPRFIATAVLALLSLAGSSSGAPPIPAECDGASTILDRLYAYFGAASFSVSPSSDLVFSGGSMVLNISFQPTFFSSSGVAVGSLGTSDAGLSIDPNADTFSVTMTGQASGTLKFYVLIREDDNQDGIIDLANGDDEWQSPEFTIPAGATTTFNFPATAFSDSGAGSGNGVREFTTTTKMAMVIDIHSRTSYAGGLITTPRTLLIDHVGFFHGSQTPPPPPVCFEDINTDGVINTSDLVLLLSAYGQTVAPGSTGDLNSDGEVNTTDLVTMLARFGQACA